MWPQRRASSYSIVLNGHHHRHSVAGSSSAVTTRLLNARKKRLMGKQTSAKWRSGRYMKRQRSSTGSNGGLRLTTTDGRASSYVCLMVPGGLRSPYICLSDSSRHPRGDICLLFYLLDLVVFTHGGSGLTLMSLCYQWYDTLLMVALWSQVNMSMVKDNGRGMPTFYINQFSSSVNRCHQIQ